MIVLMGKRNISTKDALQYYFSYCSFYNSMKPLIQKGFVKKIKDSEKKNVYTLTIDGAILSMCLMELI